MCFSNNAQELSGGEVRKDTLQKCKHQMNVNAQPNKTIAAWPIKSSFTAFFCNYFFLLSTDSEEAKDNVSLLKY